MRLWVLGAARRVRTARVDDNLRCDGSGLRLAYVGLANLYHAEGVNWQRHARPAPKYHFVLVVLIPAECKRQLMGIVCSNSLPVITCDMTITHKVWPVSSQPFLYNMHLTYGTSYRQREHALHNGPARQNHSYRRKSVTPGGADACQYIRNVLSNLISSLQTKQREVTQQVVMSGEELQVQFWQRQARLACSH